MSNSKKTQKELIAELTKVVENLTRRIENLEGNHISDWKPYPSKPKVNRKCQHCNGTGLTEDYGPYHPYYNGSNF
jgi:hypothetical protein